jgi:hypothetical protein
MPSNHKSEIVMRTSRPSHPFHLVSKATQIELGARSGSEKALAMAKNADGMYVNSGSTENQKHTQRFSAH